MEVIPQNAVEQEGGILKCWYNMKSTGWDWRVGVCVGGNNVRLNLIHTGAAQCLGSLTSLCYIVFFTTGQVFSHGH